MNKFLSVVDAPRLRPYFRWIFVTIVFFLITWVHMGSSLTHIKSVVLNTPGDHTAGIMYTTWVHPKTPIPGMTSMTNYPYGENLRLPVMVSSQVLSVGHWALSRLGNVVMGWNLLVLFGYMSNALLMFGFIRWLTKNSWAAFFSGYAVAFTPYHIFASRGQIAGLYGSLFILALWQFIALWRKPSQLKALSLGTILGVGFYTDGYFILIGLIMLACMWAASIGYGIWLKSASKVNPQLVSLVLSSIVAFLFLLPLGFINFKYASHINSLLGNARGDIKANAQMYSAQLPMYFNPKSLLFLGFSVIVLSLLGIYFVLKDYRKESHKRGDANSSLFLVCFLILMTLAAGWASLQPTIHILGITMYTPSRLIIAVTSAWRVFGRLYTLVSIGAVTLAGIGLAHLLRKFPAHIWLIVSASLLVLVFEMSIYSSTQKAPTFNYSDTPQVYRWLKNQEEVRAIAEYPLDEPPQGRYLSDYFTFQQISGKPMLNTFLPNSPNAALRGSIVGINDPQTLPVLRALGIGLINVRGVTRDGKELDLPSAAARNKQLLRQFSNSKLGYKVDSFLLKPGPTSRQALVIPDIQPHHISLDTEGHASYTMGGDITLSLFNLPGTLKNSNTNTTVAFTMQAQASDSIVAPASKRDVSIVQNGKLLWSGQLDSSPQNITLSVDSNFPIVILNQHSLTMLPRTTLSSLRTVE